MLRDIVSTAVRKAEILHLQAKLGMQELKFRRRVNAEAVERARESSYTFSTELLEFLNENPSSILAPLHPTADQLAVIYGMLHAAEEQGVGVEKEAMGIHTTTDRPVLVSIFRVFHIEIGDDEVQIENRGKVETHKVNLQSMMRSDLVTSWDVEKNYPALCTISGETVTTEDESEINLIFLPEKPTDGDNLADIFSTKRKDLDVQALVFSNGERININTTLTEGNTQHHLTDQYYYLGGFHGIGSGQDYHVYGSNTLHHEKRSVTELQASAQTTTQFAATN